MGRRTKGPRLWLRPERCDNHGKKTHDAAWLILDGTRQIATGCTVDQRGEAENALLRYCEGKPEIRTIYVYFITTERPDFPIKIGVSESHQARFIGLQTGLPYRIKVLAVLPTTDAILERRLHRKFDHLRLEGEWFEAAPELVSYIDSLVNEGRAA